MGKYIAGGMIDAYSQEGSHYLLQTISPTYGKNDLERRMFAGQFLINYFQKALQYLPKHVSLQKKIKYKIEDIFGHRGLLEVVDYSRYMQAIDNIPVAAAYYRILEDLPNRQYSEERIKQCLGIDDFLSSEDLSRNTIEDTIKILNNELSTYKEELLKEIGQ
jgi:sulfur transfer complex TusBCD TusB component (DsrH family)